MKDVSLLTVSIFAILSILIVTLWPLWVGLLVLYVISKMVGHHTKESRIRGRARRLKKSKKPQETVTAYDEEADFLETL